MIRPLTCVCMLMACGSGLYLYQAKHRAQMLDREIARTLKITDTARDRIGVLRGEWALLNEPERLSLLSQTHLGLKTLQPTQFVTLSDLGSRLPTVAAPGTVHIPSEEPGVTVLAGEPATPAPLPPHVPLPPHAPVAAPKSASPAAIPPPPGPVQVAAIRPPAPPRPAARLAEQRDQVVPTRPPQVVSAVLGPAAPLPAPRPILAPVIPVMAQAANVATAASKASPRPASLAAAPPASTGVSIGESVARMARSRAGESQADVPQPRPSQPSFSQQASNQMSASVSASVLGGARSALPPPVPFGSGLAGSR